MTKREREGLALVQIPGYRKPLDASTVALGSSTTSLNERTEDDVGDEMDWSLSCDGCKKLVGRLERRVTEMMYECCHFFCERCAPSNPKEKHTSCELTTRSSTAFVRESSPSQRAEHDGELSGEQAGGEKKMGSLRRTRTPKRPAPENLSGSARKRKSKQNEEQIWSFLYLGRPIVVAIAMDATYADLLQRLYTVLHINQTTHFIRIKKQKTSTEEDADDNFDAPGEAVNIEVPDQTKRLVDLHISRKKMLIVEVNRILTPEEMFLDSSKSPRKSSKEPEKSHDKDEMASATFSRAEEPKSN